MYAAGRCQSCYHTSFCPGWHATVCGQKLIWRSFGNIGIITKNTILASKLCRMSTILSTYGAMTFDTASGSTKKSWSV